MTTTTQSIDYSKILQDLQNLGAFGSVQSDALATNKLYDPTLSKFQAFRDTLFNQGQNAYLNATNFANQAGRAAADVYSNPFWAQGLGELSTLSADQKAASGLAQKTMAGEFLKSPTELNKAVQTVQGTAERAAADESAKIRSSMARAGMGFSTADLQAQQAAGAAQRVAAGDTAAKLMADNYATERKNQQDAATLANALTQTRTQQLGLGTDMLTNQAGLLKGYSQDMVNPITNLAGLMPYGQAGQLGVENVQKATPSDYLMQLLAVSSAPGGAEALNNLFK